MTDLIRRKQTGEAWETVLDTAAAGAILSTTVDVSANDLLNLTTTPIEVIASPGPGNYIVPLYVVGSLTYVSAFYDEGQGLSQLILAPANLGSMYATALESLRTLVKGDTGVPADQVSLDGYPPAGGAWLVSTVFEDQPFVFWNAIDPLLNGDCTLKLTILYLVVST